VVRHSLLIFLVFACAWYAILLTVGHPTHGEHALVTRPGSGLNLVFNSMAQHLLQGRFDVDPTIVDDEGFLVNGSVVAYWGIFFALLRLPLDVIPDGWGLDVTRLSMWVAVSLAALIKLKTLRLIFQRAMGHPTGWLYWLLAVTLAFSGPQIEFLRATVYQEVCLWAGVMGAAFVYLAIGGLLLEGFSTKHCCSLAAIAGIALLSRVSTGMSLYAACFFVLLVTYARVPARMVLPLAILSVFGCATAFVNYQRWGNPLVFADYHVYLWNLHHPERLQRMAAYGLFNITRVPLSLLYYLLPVWVFRNASGNLLLSADYTRLFDFTELPPSSFLLTDTLLVGLFVYAIRSMVLRTSGSARQRAQMTAIAAGLSVGGILMLTAISMAFRYRIEFYPPLEFGAFLGLYAFLRDRRQLCAENTDWRLLAGAMTSVIASHCVLLLYKLTGMAGISLPSAGFWNFYGERMHPLILKLSDWLYGAGGP
jgi:hypothetical protein